MDYENLIEKLKPGDYADVYGWPRSLRCVALDGPEGFRARMIDEDGHERYVADEDIIHIITQEVEDLRDSTLYIIRRPKSSLSNIDWTDADEGMYVIHENVARRVARIDEKGGLRSWSDGNHIIKLDKFVKMGPRPVKSVRVRTDTLEFKWNLRV